MHTHVLVQAPSGATRRYSLCNAPEDRQRYVIAVKREASGRGGSISIVDGVHVGDAMHVSLPRNEFALGHAKLRSFEGIVPRTVNWRTLGASEEELASYPPEALASGSDLEPEAGRVEA